MRKSFRLLTLALVVALAILTLSPALAQSPTQFIGGWPYSVPPDGHFNSYASGFIGLGIYVDLQQPPLAIYMWGSGEYTPMAAASFGFDDDNNYVVTLEDGNTWSDGSPITADDLVATFNTGYLSGWNVWNFMDSVEKVDDLTVKFNLSAPSLAVERFILTEGLRPSSVYGTFSDSAAALIPDKKKAGDADFDAALTALTDFRPERMISGGPYVLNPEDISDARVTLMANPGGVASDTVKFDQVVLWNGETETVTPLLANGDMWYATHGLPPATEADLISRGIDIIRTGMLSGPAIYINYDIYPLNRAEVRQAIAHAIDRDANGFVSLGESGVSPAYMAGMADGLAESWLSEEVLDSLNPYDYDVEGAAAILEGIGFTRDAAGKWMDDQGNPLAFDLKFPAEFADWSAAAENAIQALNDFGFQITGVAVQFQQQEQDVYNSDFQMAIRNWGTGSPFPGFSYLEPYRRYNGQAGLAGEAGGGMKMPLDVTYSGGEINLLDLANTSLEGLDADAQIPHIEQLAMSFNELLPIIPLWERYTNNAFNRNFLNAPPADDPVYLNDTTADAFMPTMILLGMISPAEM
jgi:peptide/nickel transport system substrate-binding protein